MTDVATSVVGPGPWLIDGVATFKILKIKKKLTLDFEVGERKSVTLPSTDVAALLIEALETPENWQVPETTGTVAAVVLIEPDDDMPPRVHPGGTIVFRQKTVPLNVQLEKFGAGTIDGPSLFEIEETRIGDGQNTYAPQNAVDEWFAPAEFLKMKDAEKLKAPAYEAFDCGAEIGGGGVQFGGAQSRAVSFEEITIDPVLNVRQQPRRKRPAKATARPARKPPKTAEKTLALAAGVTPAFDLKDAPTAFPRSRTIHRRRGG